MNETIKRLRQRGLLEIHVIEKQQSRTLYLDRSEILEIHIDEDSCAINWVSHRQRLYELDKSHYSRTPNADLAEDILNSREFAPLGYSHVDGTPRRVFVNLSCIQAITEAREHYQVVYKVAYKRLGDTPAFTKSSDPLSIDEQQQYGYSIDCID